MNLQSNGLWKYNHTHWELVRGSLVFNQYGVYSEQGASTTTDQPGGRYESVAFTDKEGYHWLFAGQGYTLNNYGGWCLRFSLISAGTLEDLWRLTIDIPEVSQSSASSIEGTITTVTNSSKTGVSTFIGPLPSSTFNTASPAPTSLKDTSSVVSETGNQGLSFSFELTNTAAMVAGVTTTVVVCVVAVPVIGLLFWKYSSRCQSRKAEPETNRSESGFVEVLNQ